MSKDVCYHKNGKKVLNSPFFLFKGIFKIEI